MGFAAEFTDDERNREEEMRSQVNIQFEAHI